MERIYKTAIVGGGAAGLTAAVMLSKYFGGDVIVLERTDRVGKKITATGNGRGNFTNEQLSADNYHSREGDAQSFVRPAISAFDNNAVKAFLEDLGAITVSENGRITANSVGSGTVTISANWNGVQVQTLTVEIQITVIE